MRPRRVVRPPSGLDHGLRLFERIEDLPVEQLIAQSGVEALAVAALPRTAFLGAYAAFGQGPLETIYAVCVIDALTDLFLLRGIPAYVRPDNVLYGEARRGMGRQSSIASLH
jgi:hypothetical protein